MLYAHLFLSRYGIATVLQIHGTAMAAALLNILMAKIEKSLIKQSEAKPLVWNWYYYDLFCL